MIPKAPLTNLQRELLKLYATDMAEEDLHELRTLLARHYAKKSINEADTLWDKKNISNQEMDKWLNEE